jgi:hypothetical protein
MAVFHSNHNNAKITERFCISTDDNSQYGVTGADALIVG